MVCSLSEEFVVFAPPEALEKVQAELAWQVAESYQHLGACVVAKDTLVPKFKARAAQAGAGLHVLLHCVSHATPAPNPLRKRSSCATLQHGVFALTQSNRPFTQLLRRARRNNVIARKHFDRMTCCR